jgi:hypothetical protein
LAWSPDGVVPGHCLAQAAREFLALYPGARILVADETNFTKDKRHRFLSRAATATWDAIIITHSAFRFIGVPSAFEQQMIQDELELYEQLLTKVETDDRVSRKRLERLKEGLKERLEALATRKDDLLTISEIGVDQIIVDEAQEFRKLSFHQHDHRRASTPPAPDLAKSLHRNEEPRPGGAASTPDHQHARRDVLARYPALRGFRIAAQSSTPTGLRRRSAQASAIRAKLVTRLPPS